MNVNLNLSSVAQPLMKPLNNSGTSELLGKKILLLAIPLILLFGLVVFARRVLKNRAAQIPQQPPRPIENRPLISVATECDRIKQQVIATINETKEISQLHSAKIFMNIECNNRRFSKDHIIRDFALGFGLNPIINEAKVFLGAQNPDRFTSKWVALLKDNNGVFHKAGGTIECSHINGEYRSSEPTSKGRGIDPNHVEEYFDIVLGRMRGETTLQLDNQLNFI